MTFGRPRPEELSELRTQRKARNMSGLLARRPDARRGTYEGASSGVAVVKLEAAKPGKRTPTKDEAAWMTAIVAYGCIACRMDGNPGRPAAVHHILRGGRRIGHKFTLPLCDPGHHQQGQQFGMVSRHPWKARFEQLYGSESFLLTVLQGTLKLQPDGSYAP